MGISCVVGGSMRQKNFKKCKKLNWNFQRGGEVLEKFLSMGRYGHFLEPHNLKNISRNKLGTSNEHHKRKQNDTC